MSRNRPGPAEGNAPPPQHTSNDDANGAVYSEDYDDDDEDASRDNRFATNAQAGRISSGGHLSLDAVTALQRLHVANAHVAAGAVHRLPASNGARDQTASMLLAATLSAQQQLQAEENEATLRFLLRQQHQVLHGTAGANGPASHHNVNHSEYIDLDDHLNRTPSEGDTDGDQTEEEGEEHEGEEATESNDDGGRGGDGGANNTNNVHEAEGQLVDMSAEEYEPTEQEILEYCEWLGLDATVDRCLMWIAREALRAPLPENWNMCYTDDREIYYFNIRTGESIWDHPMDAYYKSLYKEEKAKLDKKRKRTRMFSRCLVMKPLSEFFSELSETCGLGSIVLPTDESIAPPSESTSDLQLRPTASTTSIDDAPPPWTEVPESFVDPIDFRIFLDPVVLPTSGRTVSRHTIINNTWRDPFTREYCENRRLVPNVDKRAEVDRWLLQMVQAYVQRMRGGCRSGLQRLITILPHLLDRDEEACVRGQTLVLSWLTTQLENDAKHAVTMEIHARELSEYREALATQQQNQQHVVVDQHAPGAKASPSVSPRGEHPPTGGGGGPSIRSNGAGNRSTNGKSGGAGASHRATGSHPLAKSSEVPLKKLHSALHHSRSASVAPSAVHALQPTGGPPLQPPPAIVPRQLLPDLLTNSIASEEQETLLLSLLSMSTSASREALLLLVSHAPLLLQHRALGGIDEEVQFVLRIAKKDLCEIAVAAAEAESRLLQKKGTTTAASGRPYATTTATDDGGVERTTRHHHNSSSAPHGLPLATSSANSGGPATNPSSHGFSMSVQEGQGLPTTDDEPELSFEEQLAAHRMTDSEKALSLKWIALLSDGSLDVMVAPHPVTTLDLMSAMHVVLCAVATLPPQSPQRQERNGAASPPPPVVVNVARLVGLLMRCDGWPLQLAAVPDKHLRVLLELSARCVEDPRCQIQALFDLTLHGSERCLDVIKRHSAAIKQNLVQFLTSSSNASSSSGSSTAAAVDASCTNADLMAAVMIFHELASLEEFAAVCSPFAAIKIGYNLTPRLARSQWRPKHFHHTVATFVGLVEQHPLDAWAVMDRVGLTFFLRELAKKKGTSPEIKSKIEGLEYSEKQLDQSACIARWGLLSARLTHQRQQATLRTVEEKLQAKRAARPAVGEQENVATPRSGLPTPRQQPSRSTNKVAARTASVVAPLPLVPPQPTSGILPSLIAAVAMAKAHEEFSAKKYDDLTRQRASLLSQALMLLITVRLKPKQHRSSAAAQGVTAGESPMVHGGSNRGPLPTGGQRRDSANALAAGAKHPVLHGDGSRGPPTPRQLDLGASTGAGGAVPPPAPTSLPNLRAPRGGMNAGGSSVTEVVPHTPTRVVQMQASASSIGFLPPI